MVRGYLVKMEDFLNKDCDTIEELISYMNEQEVKDKITGVCNKRNINFEKVEQKDIKLYKLNRQINEVREILNDVCCTLDIDVAIDDRLIISQYLDELIVKYMKELNCNSKI